MNSAVSPAPLDGSSILLAIFADCWLLGYEASALAGPLAPTAGDRFTIAKLATAQFGEASQLSQALAARGHDLATAGERYLPALGTFASQTQPQNWSQAMLKALLTAGFSLDLGVLLENRLDHELHTLLFDSATAWQVQDFASRQLSDESTATTDQADALALFGRRLVAEALGQAQRIAAQDPGLSATVGTGNGEEDDLAQVAELLENMVQANARRMGRFGLAA